MGLLEGKVAVITGAGSGMGKACAQIFAREGAKLVIADISGREEATAAEIGGRDVAAIRCDISKEAEVAATVEKAVSAFGRLDAILNVGGIGAGGSLVDLDEKELDRVLNINLKGVMWGAKYAVRAMKDNGGGVVINWSSLAGIMPTAGCVAYNVAKAGVVSLTRAIALEYGPNNIRSHAICPGLILTEMGRQGLAHAPSRGTSNPLRRPGEAEDAGELAAFLASDRANYLNGLTIPVDGGWSIMLT
jgi:NAD(P)-dependent dehydrogenase (short-subunit alcohol dehydrogenase family)